MPRKKDSEIQQYQLKDGKTYYRLKTYIGINPETKRPVKVTRSKLKTRKEAEQLRIKLKAQGATKIGRKQYLNKQQITVTDVWNSWLRVYKLDARGSTIVHKKMIWNNHIKPRFGEVYISHISSEHVQNFVDDMANNYLEYRSYINLLKSLIKHAIIKGWTDYDPFNRVVIPKKSAKKHTRNPKDNYLELDELQRFLTAAKKLHFEWYVYFFITASLGVRRGESLALKWPDINWNDKLIYIRRTVTTDEQGHKALGPTKTSDKYRKNNGLPISDHLLKVLKEFKAYRTKWYDKSEFLFHTPDNDFYTTQAPSFWLAQLYKHDPTLKHITMHGLRHTLATLMFETNDNLNPEDVAYQLGHKHVSTTLDIYTSITKKKKAELTKTRNKLGL